MSMDMPGGDPDRPSRPRAGRAGIGAGLLGANLLLGVCLLVHGDSEEAATRLAPMEQLAASFVGTDLPDVQTFLQSIGLAQVLTEQWEPAITYLAAVADFARRQGAIAMFGCRGHVPGRGATGGPVGGMTPTAS